MAARKNAHLTDEWRRKIQTSMLLNRLQDQAFDKIEMSDKAVQAAKILLAKSLPDLKAIDYTGDINASGRIEIVIIGED